MSPPRSALVFCGRERLEARYRPAVVAALWESIVGAALLKRRDVSQR